MATGLREKFFSFVHSNHLIYNTCWEDPRIDRELLKLSPESNAVAITSAGCNVLDYLLDGPATIHAVDVNFRQNALLYLKMAIIGHSDQESLFALFGRGGWPSYQEIYAQVRPQLPLWSKKFWDDRIGYFSSHGLRPSFYWHGAAGVFAWLLQTTLTKNNSLKPLLYKLLRAKSLDDQKQLFDQVEPLIFKQGVMWMLRQPAAMALIGVPTSQLSLIENQYSGGLASFIRDGLRRVFTTLPIGDNYFWRVYITGGYSPDCCPQYLRPENFQTLRERLPRIQVYNNTIAAFLQENPGEYSHFILLDHQDWLAWHDTNALAEEWEEILRNSRPGTKILMRSAGLDLDFLPDSVASRLRFFPHLTQALHLRDRVGTYGSLHLAEVV